MTYGCITASKLRSRLVIHNKAVALVPLQVGVLLLLTCLAPTQQTCNKTVWQFIEEEIPSFYGLVKAKTGEFGVVDWLNDTRNTVTTFAPTDAASLATLRTLSAQGANPENSPLLYVLTANGSTYNAVALSYMIVGRAWDADALINLRTVDAALSFFVPGNFSYTFNYNQSEVPPRVTVTSSFGYQANIVKTLMACNGYIHLIDGIFVPGREPSQFPDLDVHWEDMNSLIPRETCGLSWQDELQGVPQIAAVLQQLDQSVPGLTPHILATNRTMTLLLPNFESAAALANTDAGNAIKASPEEFLRYSSLEQALCPSELVNDGPVLQTRLGDGRALLLPLLFYPTEDGMVEITSPRETPWSAQITDTWTVCGTTVYLYSGVLDFRDLPQFGYPTPLLELTPESRETEIPLCVYPLTEAVLPDVFDRVNATRWTSVPATSRPPVPPPRIASPSPGVPAPVITQSQSGSTNLVAILVPSLLCGALLIITVVIVAVVMIKRKRRLAADAAMYTINSKHSYDASYQGYRGDANANTQDLMHQIVAAASGKDVVKLASWKDRKHGTSGSASTGFQNSLGCISDTGLGKDNSDDFDDSGVISPATSWRAPAGDGVESWELSPDELEFCKGEDGSPLRLGAGGCGEVYKGVRGGVQDVAIKVLSRQAPGGVEAKEALMQEIKVLKDLRDGNVVQFYGACVRNHNLMLVTEYLAGGDLRRALHGPDSEQYRWNNRGQYIALDIAKGLSYLHSRRVVHLDLKSANILLSCDGSAKIADMGLAQVMKGTEQLQGIMQGTYAWAAPELLANTKLTEKADCYSFGVIMWELVTLQNPSRGRMRAIKAPEECPELIAELIGACLSFSTADRPSAREAFEAIRSCLDTSRTHAPASVGRHHGGNSGPWNTGGTSHSATSVHSVTETQPLTSGTPNTSGTFLAKHKAESVVSATMRKVAIGHGVLPSPYMAGGNSGSIAEDEEEGAGTFHTAPLQVASRKGLFGSTAVPPVTPASGHSDKDMAYTGRSNSGMLGPISSDLGASFTIPETGAVLHEADAIATSSGSIMSGMKAQDKESGALPPPAAPRVNALHRSRSNRLK